MEDTQTLSFESLPLFTLPPNPPRSKVRCLRCRTQRKRCDRVDGEDCSLCQKAGVRCGRSLNFKEARALKAQSQSDLMSETAKEDIKFEENGPPGAVNNPYQRSTVEPDPSGEGTAFDRQKTLEEMDMFDRKHLGNDLNRWSAKLNQLLLSESTLRETLVALYPQALGSSGPVTSQGFALQAVVKELEWTLEELTKLADTAVTNADNDRADRIFLNIWDGLQSTNCLCVSLRFSALSKIVLFYRDIGNEPRCQRALRYLSSLATSAEYSPEIEHTKINPHRMLGHSLVSTSKSLHASFIKSGASSVGAVIRSPALNQSIRFENPEVFQVTLNAVENKAAYLAAQVVQGHRRNYGTAGSDESINTRDTLDRSPLFVAAALGKESHCIDLLDAGARVDERDCNGRSILTVAAGRGLVNVAKRILSLRIEEANPVNLMYSSTPLQEAAAAGHGEVVTVLLEHGADPRTRRLLDGEKSAVDLAKENGFMVIAKELEERAAALNYDFLTEERAAAVNSDFLNGEDSDFTQDFIAQEYPESQPNGGMDNQW